MEVKDLKEPVFKAAKQSDSDPFEFVLSDETVDRAGDIIRVAGWELDEFLANPVALFGHDHATVIGKWEKLRVEGKRLMARLHMAAVGTSAFIDTVRSLIEQRILRAVSVGAQILDFEPLESGGLEIKRASLLEVSVVAVPANPNALAIAKAFAPDPKIVDQVLKSEEGESAEPESNPVEPDNPNPETETPRMDAMRERLKAMGIELE